MNSTKTKTYSDVRDARDRLDAAKTAAREEGVALDVRGLLSQAQSAVTAVLAALEREL